VRIRDRQLHDEPEISLIPLIDVVLVLIIFFVVTTTFDARSTLQLQLPKADGQAGQTQGKRLSVLINAEGRYFVGDNEVLRTDIDALKQAIREASGGDTNQPVLLRADARVPYQAVVTAQDALGQLGFRQLIVATAPEQKP
jgi:biopolymer transport protein ExbD